MMSGTASAPPAPPFVGLHHAAFLCRDAEETRHFYEDILGLTMIAAMTFPGGLALSRAYAAELDDADAAEPPDTMLTMFFEVAPGSYLTFFDLPQTVAEDRFKTRDGHLEYHVALEARTSEELEQIRERLRAHGVPVSEPVDMKAYRSAYFYDPNGIHLEITARTPVHDELIGQIAEMASANHRRWTSETASLRADRLAGSEAVRRESADRARRVIERITEVAAEPVANAGRS
jgi:catechol 2,3-dioxygenase-like lactoylglutathione lyase family enzyme